MYFMPKTTSFNWLRIRLKKSGAGPSQTPSMVPSLLHFFHVVYVLEILFQARVSHSVFMTYCLCTIIHKEISLFQNHVTFEFLVYLDGCFFSETRGRVAVVVRATSDSSDSSTSLSVVESVQNLVSTFLHHTL